ncbi:Guanosine-diphosphatase [Apophysomyces ossiformis]|uniref:guanosine-diphosphatase n=1 Tax=Apophysomyces ossiformis TaxID=679940 RepID=A0A8H7EV04_9FUNG|nr:Guanosine-diphosphatase [Apophysomyces ossiformis]
MTSPTTSPPKSRQTVKGNGRHGFLFIVLFGIVLAWSASLISREQLTDVFNKWKSNQDIAGSPDQGTQPDCLKYALMVDAGSTGSRIHVYRFHQCPSESIRLEEEQLFIQTIPGLSAYDDPQQAAESLDVLMKAALDTVPAALHRTTPIEVKATAGLRLLGQEKSNAILKAVQRHLQTVYPFPITPNGVTIMDGRDEGVYAWITVNFLLGNFESDKNHTAAVFDLGGGSTQIVFEPEQKDVIAEHGDHKYTLSFNQKDYVLYQHSYLGFGLMEARKRMHQKVLQLGSQDRHPCLPRNLDWPFNEMTFVGDGSYEACTQVVQELLNKDAMCLAPPCSFDGIHQPPIDEAFKDGPIYIFSYFYDRTQPLGLPASFRLPQLAELTSRVCSGEFLAAVDDDELREEIIGRPEWCLDLSYIYGLLSHGYEIPDDRVITIAKKIDGVETGWCLGAAIAMLDNHWTQ